MSRSSDIKCDICSRQFKTYSVVEQHVEDYSLENVTCYYPLPEENAHLVRNYICDDCYNKLGDIVRQLFIDKGHKYIEELENRKLKAYEKYEGEVAKLEEENKTISEITKRVKASKSILDLDDQTIKDLQKNFPYTTNATYYLESAVDIEKRTKQGKRKVFEWAEQYDLKIDSDRYFDMVTISEFKNILKDSKVLNVSDKELSEILETI